MAQHCGKHDIVFTEGGECWCCEESSLTPEQKAKAYKDPEFLRKRASNSPNNPAPFNPDTLTDEQVEALAARFSALATAKAAASSEAAIRGAAN